MLSRFLTFGIAVLAIAVAALARPAVAEDAAGRFAVEAAYAAVTAGDLDAAVAFLTEDAVFAVVPASRRMEAPALVGKEAIRGWWAGTHKDNGRVEFSDLRQDGDRATFTCLYHGDLLAKLGVSPAAFDGVAILRDGKIRVLVWSYSKEYEPGLKAALAKAAN